MFNFILDREQEIQLLLFTKLEAKCNKHNIQEAIKLEDELKSDGTIHKTKLAKKKSIINGWKKEQKKLKSFFIEHQMEKAHDDYKNYKFRRGITDNRQGIEGTTTNIGS